ncbi:MAG: CopG family transcriptional regulator [Phenylobacterium sp.]|uniref:CopG family transcriptional regulator n=1 Tax=Phenylobacterium sp. TaxID=1871053 RepID=UPI001A3D641A|nr:CopG family transcriptional regulator [Phenylobacterium sp.]MBL8553945.1 CopG family transcriptional regulator [Phenylobacterium sp.]
MRTTLSIDDDVLEAARFMAEVQKRSLGEVVSDLVRRALDPPADPTPHYRNGILLLPRRDGPPTTLEMIRQIDEETP